MHQPSHLLRGGRELVHTRDLVHGFRGCKMVTHRADAAQTLDDNRNLPEHPAANEPFESAKLDDVEASIIHFAGFIQTNGDLAVSFYPRHRVDHDLAGT